MVHAGPEETSKPGSGAAHRQPDGVTEWFLAVADAHPDLPAVIEAGTVTTYGQLAGRARAVAKLLAEHGVRHEIVPVSAPRGADGIAAAVGVLLGGCALLPLDLQQPAARLHEILKGSGARLVLTVGAHPFAGSGTRATVVALDERPGPGQRLRAPAATDAVVARGAGYVVYTSGSTGRPKGIVMGRRSLDLLIAWHRSHREPLGRRTAQFAAVGFDVALQEVFATLCCGGCLVAVDEATRRDPEQVVDLLVRERVQRLFLPTAALARIAAACLPRTSELTLQDVVCAGEQLVVTGPVRELFALTGASLWNHYGPAETHVVTALELTGDPAAWPDRPPLGTALPRVRIRVEPATDGSGQGELLLGGERLAHGYLGDPATTRARFVEDGAERWYRTGDLVAEGPSGPEYRGRVDRQLKVSGYRVEPAEVEQCLLANVDVAECVVDLAPAVGDLSAALRAQVVLRRPRERAELAQELRRLAAASLPAHMLVRDVNVVDRMPLTVNGKIDLAALAEHAPAPAEHASIGVPGVPRTVNVSGRVPSGEQAEEFLGAAVARRLGLARVDPHASLFDLGASSMMLAELRDELADWLGRPVPIAVLYAEPTVSRLADAVSADPAAPAGDEREDHLPRPAAAAASRRAARRERRLTGRPE